MLPLRCRNVCRLGWEQGEMSGVLVPAWSWAGEPRMGDDHKAVASREVLEALSQCHRVHSVATLASCGWPWWWLGTCRAQPCSTHQPAPGKSRCLLCPVCTELPKSLHICFPPATADACCSLEKQLVIGISQAWWLGRGGWSSRARGWTQWYFLQGRCLGCFLALALLQARTGIMCVLEI